MSGRFSWLIASWTLAIAALAVALPAAPARADGKFFAPIAEPTPPTIPAQRAIIGWDPPYQTLAIDTALTGPGAEFAWLIPLPSDPEITEATPGAFETIAALTQPRIDRYPDQSLLILACVIISMGSLLVIMRGRGAVVPVLIAGAVFGIVFGFTAIGTARSGVVTALGVEVRERSRVGVYDTAVLKADRASDLLAWLDASGFAAPAGSAEVMQRYLDRGWVFAAARVAADVRADPAAELHPHPLAFRFRTDQPVYPMALTAIGNTPIRLDLFVFADGSASADAMRAASSRLVVHAPSTDPMDVQSRTASGETRVGHAGLTRLAAGKPHVTHLTADLAPDEQREDIAIEIGSFRAHGERLYRPGSGSMHGLMVGSVTVAAMLVALAVARVRQNIERRAGSLLSGVAVLLAGGVGIITGAALPEYEGALNWRYRVSLLARVPQTIGEVAPTTAEREGVTDREGLLAIVAELLTYMDVDDPRYPDFGLGDGPWSYDIEADPDEGGQWLFVWRDAAGGAHGVRLTGPEAGESVYASD